MKLCGYGLRGRLFGWSPEVCKPLYRAPYYPDGFAHSLVDSEWIQLEMIG
jgi:hypothetical protein